MILTIDTEKQTLNGDPLYAKDSFEVLSDLWLKVGWDLKYPYSFSWLGFPILQIPEDMIRTQEVICRLRPDYILETGIAHGGSLIYYASLCKLMDHGHVVGVEKGLRCRAEVERHPLSEYITMIEGDSTAPAIVGDVWDICEGSKTLVILDSNHSKHHVMRELNAYHGLIEKDFYIVASDGNMQELADVPRGSPEWSWNNPQEAAKEFAKTHTEFCIEQPEWPFNESQLTRNTTYWPSAWLRRT